MKHRRLVAISRACYKRGWKLIAVIHKESLMIMNLIQIPRQAALLKERINTEFRTKPHSLGITAIDLVLNTEPTTITTLYASKHIGSTERHKWKICFKK